MSKIYFIADLHFGHKNIAKFEGHNRGNVTTVEENDQWLINQWNSLVTKNDLVWVLGDVAFSKEGLDKVKLLNGTKHLILGNHDHYSLDLYLKYFNKIHGFLDYKGMFLSHAPILNSSLRGKGNVHGHIHSKAAPSNQHFCVSVEQCSGVPISLETIIDHFKKEGFRE